MVSLLVFKPAWSAGITIVTSFTPPLAISIPSVKLLTDTLIFVLSFPDTSNSEKQTITYVLGLYPFTEKVAISFCDLGA
jgi:hypothetical protein